jgi:pyridoxamine 5'-phosphate oxidase
MAGLTEKDFGPDPLPEFGRWFDYARANSGQANPNAMTLCTVGAGGEPQGRIVLLKGWAADGFCFYSSAGSEKGQALAVHPYAELVFHWDGLRRQVRVRGSVERLSAEQAQAYFMTRPRGSRLATWASDQSQPVASREAMEARYAEIERRFEGQEVPAPPHWQGFRLVPSRMEFWQEGQFRFHDRFVYLREGAAWRFSRLNP